MSGEHIFSILEILSKAVREMLLRNKLYEGAFRVAGIS